MTMNTTPKFEMTFHILEHGAGINVLKLSPDGTRLLSGANDGTVTVWDLETGLSIQSWILSASQSITAATWCSAFDDRPHDAFAIGDAHGSLSVYRKSGPSYDYADSAQLFTGPVEDIAYDKAHRRLAGVGDGCLRLYRFTEPYYLSFIHGTTPRPHTARTASFYANGTCIFVCYLESQHITGYEISPWAVQFDGDIDTRIGHAALKSDSDLFVTNLMNGMDVYSFPPASIPKRNLRFHIEKNFPLMVAVSSMADFVVVGGEDGFARLYDNNLGLLAGTLPHGNRDSLIQHVDLHVSNGKTLVATGCADEGGGSIKIWEPSGQRAKVSVNAASAVPKSASLCWAVGVLLVACFYFVVVSLLCRLWPHVSSYMLNEFRTLKGSRIASILKIGL